MDKKKKKKLIIALIALAILIVFFNTSFARYVYNSINNYILESQGFYFNSTTVSINNERYNINNWDGINSYVLNVDVNNKKNEKVYTNSDISYDISVDCSTNVTCSLSKNSGVIIKDNKNDSYVITVTPNSQIGISERVTVNTSVTSTFPYVKTMSATYTLGIETPKFSYEIIDNPGDKFLTLKIDNAVSYYEVMTAFGSYSVGDHISLATYATLTSAEKSNCFSARIQLAFSPNQIYLDMTDKTYANRINGSATTTTVNSYPYVNGYQFYVLANSNTEIKFYKKSISQNYTFPIVNATPVITLTATTAS